MQYILTDSELIEARQSLKGVVDDQRATLVAARKMILAEAGFECSYGSSYDMAYCDDCPVSDIFSDLPVIHISSHCTGDDLRTVSKAICTLPRRYSK